MNRNSALALSVVERTCDQIDQGQEYYDGIVNFLNSRENQSMKLSSLEEELAQRAARDFDAFYETRQCSPSDNAETGLIMVITAYRKKIGLLWWTGRINKFTVFETKQTISQYFRQS